MTDILTNKTKGRHTAILSLEKVELELELAYLAHPLYKTIDLRECRVLSCKAKPCIDVESFSCRANYTARVNNDNIIEVRYHELPAEWLGLSSDEFEAVFDDSKVKYSNWQSFIKTGTRFFEVVDRLVSQELITRDELKNLSNAFFPSTASLFNYVFDLNLALKNLGLQIFSNSPEIKKDKTDKTPQKGRAGYIYLVSDGTNVKVGFSINPATRMNNLQTAHSKRLTLLAEIKANLFEEQKFHRENRHLAVSGEWYPLEMIEGIKKKLGINN
jgi:hypothetical protein